MILAVLQARMSSSRLPGKVLKPLSGAPMISRQIERVARATRIDRIVVATSVMRRLGEGCEIGRNSGIGQFGFIGCGGGVSIGANVIMGQYVSFHTERHGFADPLRPMVAQGVERAGITIGDDVWIGAKATFLPGASVGRGCVVAAGAVVRGVVPEGAIVGGVPARVIGWRPGFGTGGAVATEAVAG